MKRSLVTGVAGFIGSHLAERLIAEGQAVVGIDSFTDYYPRSAKESNIRTLLREAQFSLVEADLMDLDLTPLLRGSNYVFHQAAQAGVRSSWGRNFEMYTSRNILATQRLLEACKNAFLDCFIYASSSSVYGEAQDLPFREDGAVLPVSPYGVTKLAGEHLCRTYCKHYKLPVISLRYFSVYGPRQRPDMAFHRFMKSLLLGRKIAIYGDGTQTRDFTYIADVIEGNLLAMQSGAIGEIFNIGGGSRASVNQAIDILHSLSGINPEVEYQSIQRGDVRDTLAETSKARDILGFRPRVDLRRGLAAQWRWFSENGKGNYNVKQGGSHDAQQ